MSKGMDMMVQSLIKMLGLDPRIMMEKVEEIRKSLSNAAADMATMRRQNTAIMAHLGIPDIVENDDGQNRQIDARTGDHGHGGNSGSAGTPGADAGGRN